MSDSGSPSERPSSSLVPTDSGPRASIFQVEEILRLIVEELGERTGKNVSYRNKKSLASLVATCKSFEGSLQTFLYVQDFKDREMRGMRYAITRCQDHIVIGVLNKYPENLLKTCVNARFGFGGGPTGHCHLTMLHLAAFRDMYDTIGKLHELGAKWLYAKNFQAALSSGFRGTLSSFPALQSVLNDIEWAPNFACLVKTDRDKHTCELLAKYWPESYPFVGKFTYPPALLPGRPRDEEYRMTLLHLSLLLAPGRDTVKMMDWTLEHYPELKQLPGTEHECSIQHIAVKAQNEAVVRRLVVECDIGPYFVDNRGYNPLHVAVELVLQGGDSLRPRGQSGATKILNLIIDRRSTNPMMPQTMAPYQTPLLMVASYVFIDWSGRNSVIKKCIDLVVKCEKGYADARGFGRVVYTMNRSDSNGNTVLGYITKAIVNYHVESGSKPLEDLFSKMITEYNADINLDVNKFPSPTNRPYVHSIKWMADHASGRSRFKKLVNDLGGHLHHAEVLGIAAPTDASAGFPPDQLHALHLPLNHPYALPQSLNSLRTFAIELANLQASLQRGRPGMIHMAMQMFGKSQSEAEEEFSRIVEQRTQMFIRRCGSEARQSSEHLREGPGS